MNEINLKEFIPIIREAKIIGTNNNFCLFKEGSEIKGYYILIQGGIKVKTYSYQISELNKEFLENILQEYNLNFNEVNWKIKSIKSNDNSFNNINNKNIFFKESNYTMRTSINLNQSILKKFKLNSKLEKKKENELFTYNLNNNNNKHLIFGGTSLFREITIKNNIHFSSAYTYIENKSFNKDFLFKNEKNIFNSPEILLLYIDISRIKSLIEKISKSEKNKIDFVLSHIPPCKNLNKNQFDLFFSNIEEFYIPAHTQINNKDEEKNFYLIYKGSCESEKANDIIYDEGDFIFLEKLFGKKGKKLYTKNFETILFKINIFTIPIDSRNSFQKYFKYILTSQYYLRKRYKINKRIFQEKSNNHKIKSEEKIREKEIENNQLKLKLKKKEIPRLQSAFVSNKKFNDKRLTLLSNDSEIFYLRRKGILEEKLKKKTICIKSDNDLSLIDKSISTNFSIQSKKRVNQLLRNNNYSKFTKKEISKTSRNLYSRLTIEKNSEIKFDLLQKEINNDKPIIKFNGLNDNYYNYNTIKLDSVRGEYENKSRKLLTPQEKINEIVKIWKESIKNEKNKFQTNHFKIPLLHKLCEKRMKKLKY